MVLRLMDAKSRAVVNSKNTATYSALRRRVSWRPLPAHRGDRRFEDLEAMRRSRSGFETANHWLVGGEWSCGSREAMAELSRASSIDFTRHVVNAPRHILGICFNLPSDLRTVDAC